MLTLALIAIVTSGPVSATTAGRGVEARPLPCDRGTARLVAVAVAAAQDILRIDQASAMAFVSVSSFERSTGVAPLAAATLDSTHMAILQPRLLDLPPPVC